MRERVLLLVDTAGSPEQKEIAKNLEASDCELEVFDVARVTDGVSGLDRKLAVVDRVLLLQTGPASVALRRIVDYVRLSVPVWSVTSEGVSPVPGTRSLGVGALDASSSWLSAGEPSAETVRADAKQQSRIRRYPWAAVGAAFLVLLGAVVMVWHLLDDLAAHRAVTSQDLVELDAYLRDWQDGGHRAEVIRERVSRVVIQIPEMATVAGEAAPPAEDDRAWLDFDADDWSSLPAIVLLRIADEKHGMPAIAAAARAGDGEAAHLMGVAFLFGAFLIEPDREVAKKLFGAACAVGLQRGCFNVGHALSQYSDDPADHSEGFERLLESCEADIEMSCVNVALWIEQRGQHAFPGETDESFLREHCEAGSVFLCAWLGRRIYERSDATPEEIAVAIRLLKEGCEVSDAVACYHLAEAYRDGRGVDVDEERALRLYVISCNAGFSTGCGRASEAYFRGIGTEKEPRHTLLYAEKACTYGDQWGCFRVGYALANGQGGLRRDRDRAAQYYGHACTNDSSAACFNLGLLHRHNGFAGAETDLAVSFFGKACELGNRRACSFEGTELAEDGDGTRAVAQMRLGCDRGDKFGCHFLGEALRDGLSGETDIAGARDAFERALEIDDEMGQARRALESLEEH